MIIAPISSGSNGNCILIENNGTKLLVDAGVSKKKIEEGLSFFGYHPNDIDALLITHEHTDHIKGLGVLLREYDIPAYTTKKTIDYLLTEANIGTVDKALFHHVSPENHFVINDLSVMPISISHDALDPVCYRFDSENKSCAIVTDLGTYDNKLISQLASLDSILIEANYDMRMLQTGPYPYNLKRRIWGKLGHLSNEAGGRLLGEIASDKLKNIILGHLSEKNNYPELAYEAVRNEIDFADNPYTSDAFDIKVASREQPSCMVEF